MHNNFAKTVTILCLEKPTLHKQATEKRNSKPKQRTTHKKNSFFPLRKEILTYKINFFSVLIYKK